MIETLGKGSVGTSASPEKRILLEESVDRSSNDLSSLVTSTPVKAVRNASVRKIQIPPLRPPTCSTSDHGAIRGKGFWHRKQNCVIIMYAKFKTRTAGYWNTISDAVSQTSLFRGWKEIGDVCTQANRKVLVKVFI